ncbi:putative Type IV prepilin peptidase TadV/CpaA [Vibrio nigripulchritudo SOn1]|uniref:Type IV prepilin peptidase TadV/CpaA n=1 Tax=Vibrio nigripulchritudo SOn1 TaxID=1238450 RepID=A0AAV2VY03_9VIBR|nr:A24 family peptidase [Vibrio nigripulchritudo]CCO49650.1 putative Type IV prepilin peptidase TadV/CpaA [Vibrio nigripulchritudo SOn1]
MNIELSLNALLFVALCILGIAICVSDIRHRRIPNKLVLLVALCTLPLAFNNGFIWDSLPYAVLLFVIGFVATVIGIWGGGDTKLLTAFAIGIHPDYLLLSVMSMFLLGGIQVIIMALYYRSLKTFREKGIAYGIPIVISSTAMCFISVISGF